MIKPYLVEKAENEFVFQTGQGENGSYTKDSYARAIKRAARRAGVPHWSPNRLRHSRGSEIRKRFGVEAASTVLGHANLKTTEIYAERNLELAARIMKELG